MTAVAGVIAAAASVTFGDDEPIVLSGEPRRLRGAVRLRNDGGDEVVLRRNRIAPTDGAATPIAFRPTRIPSVRLAPSAETTVPLRLRIDPHTPPGEYRQTMEIGGVPREVLLVVTERLRIRLSPAVVTVPTAPGARIDRRVTVENRGNVPVTVPDTLVAVLDDERFECRVLRRALAEVDDEEATLQGYLDQLIRAGKATLEETGHVGIRVAGGPVTVEPGTLVPLELAVQLPKGIDRRSRYRGVVPVATADLTVQLVPTGAPGREPAGAGDPAAAAAPEESEESPT